MQRYNVFNKVHKALKAMLYDTALCLQQTDFTDDEEGNAVIQKVIGLVQLVNEHAQNEDAFILPAIAAYEPSVADVFSGAGVLEADLDYSLYKVVTEICNTDTNYDKEIKGSELTRLFTQFLTAHVKQMEKEERILNTILWKYYSDEELKAKERKLVRSMPAETQDTFTRWMLRGINKKETVQWLKTVEKVATANAFKTLFATAQKELPKNKFQQVLESLTEGVMLS